MCLERIDDYPLNTNIGFKIFNIRNGLLYSAIFKRSLPDNFWFTEQTNDGPYNLNEWIQDESNYNIGIQFITFYRSGFHLYKTFPENLKQTSTSKFFKVLFSNVVCKGWQHGLQVVVARRMKILNEIKGI